MDDKKRIFTFDKNIPFSQQFNRHFRPINIQGCPVDTSIWAKIKYLYLVLLSCRYIQFNIFRYLYESNPLCWGGSRLIVTHRVASSQSWAQCGHWTLGISLIGLNTGSTPAYSSSGRRREGSASSMNGDGRILDPILL